MPYDPVFVDFDAGLPFAAACYGLFYGCYWRIVFWLFERKSKFLGLSLVLLMFTVLKDICHQMTIMITDVCTVMFQQELLSIQPN